MIGASGTGRKRGRKFIDNSDGIIEGELEEEIDE